LANAMAMGLLAMIGEREVFTENDAARFESELAKLIEKELSEPRIKWHEDPNECYGSRGIHVDYHYGDPLRAACIASGLKPPEGRFPIKTNMDIKPGFVTVRSGYRSPLQVVYAKEGRQWCLIVGGLKYGRFSHVIADPPKPFVRLEFLDNKSEELTPLHYECHLFADGEKQNPVYVLQGMDIEEAKAIVAEIERPT